MQLKWSQILHRLESKGPDGKFLHACTGGETDEELCELVLRLTENCSVCHSCEACLFRPLTSLTYASQRRLVNGFSRETCLQILEEEWVCRNFGGGRNCQIN